jgi:antirestriction protein ArdC
MYYNAYTQKHYEGKNVEILKATGLSGGFLTFNQAIKLGYKVPKGTKSIAKLNKPHRELIENGNGKLEEKMSARKFYVFHTSQLIQES